ncbi:MAG: GNAT family N-acetyltransferase [Anaerolineales bacterium]|nr:GNAT family N-acetyltransferase [Anaerolineales bacterium]
MDFAIRLARSGDAPALADLIRELGMFAYLAAEPAQATGVRVAEHLSMCLADDSHLVCVAEDGDGVIAGYVAVHWLPYLILAGPEGYVSELFVRELARGQGLGARLLEAVEVEARRRGCTRLMLLNMRPRESYRRGFYAKRGWQERPEAANFLRDLEG